MDNSGYHLQGIDNSWACTGYEITLGLIYPIVFSGTRLIYAVFCFSPVERIISFLASASTSYNNLWIHLHYCFWIYLRITGKIMKYIFSFRRIIAVLGDPYHAIFQSESKDDLGI